ncbi:MAG: hypothetical protein MUF23_17865, partial [Pirellula sp.]|nr:hypothetical protein [Pirellula sp.]
MRSITQAMLWESSRHWYWLAIGFVLGALFPFLSLLSLRSLGMPPDAPELIRLQTFLFPFHCLLLTLGVIGMQGPPQRLYG